MSIDVGEVFIRVWSAVPCTEMIACMPPEHWPGTLDMYEKLPGVLKVCENWPLVMTPLWNSGWAATLQLPSLWTTLWPSKADHRCRLLVPTETVGAMLTWSREHPDDLVTDVDRQAAGSERQSRADYHGVGFRSNCCQASRSEEKKHGRGGSHDGCEVVALRAVCCVEALEGG